MCKSIEAAVSMVNYGIEYAEKHSKPEFYMNYVKLHKLLFIAQCYMLSQYEQTLFEEAIEAHNCGPYVQGIGDIPVEYGYGELKEKIDTDKNTNLIYLPLSLTRNNVIKTIVEQFGAMNADQLVAFTKNMPAYQYHEGNYDAHLPIPLQILAETGKTKVLFNT